MVAARRLVAAPRLVELGIMVAARRRVRVHDQRACRRSGGRRQERRA